MQKFLNADQIKSFYHNFFVKQQFEDFKCIAFPLIKNSKVAVDIGGGCGYFANAIHKELSLHLRVIDLDPVSVDTARNFGLEAEVGDALSPIKHGDEGVVCFNLILHHLVCVSDRETYSLQRKALNIWRDTDTYLFVNEYIYESWFGNVSGWLIYQVTKNKALSALGRMVAVILPSLNANTFGVGVRFRSNREWRRLFSDAGFQVVGQVKGNKELVSLPRRLLLIKEIRRDSFLLSSK